MTSAPAMAISAAVPRSGCTTTRLTGTRMSTASTTSDGQPGGSGRSCRYQAHIIGTASFMSSRGLEAEQSEVEPALRAHADVADGRHHQQQQAAAARTARASSGAGSWG